MTTPGRPSESAADLAKLASLILANSPFDGTFELRPSGLFVSKYSATSPEAYHTIQQPALCLVAQGAKQVRLGGELFEYNASRMLVYSVDVPVSTRLLKASLGEPYLGLRLDLDPAKILELTAKVFPLGVAKNMEGRAICVDRIDGPILNAMVRLVELSAQPGDVDLIAPLVVEELLLRLLKSSLGPRLALIAQEDSKIHRISKAIAWVRSNFDRPLDVERLANLVHMSQSTFHQHFKAITSLSPLQYQKALRLQEARRLMLLAKLDVSAAGRRVGYQSVPQFTREYGRYFGNAPSKDISLLRNQSAHQT